MKRTTILAAALVLFASQSVLAQPDDDFGGWGDDEQTDGAEAEAEVGASGEVSATAAVPAASGPRTFGWGVNRALAGFVAPEIEYYIGDSLMISGMFGLTFVSPDVGDSQALIVLAPAVFYRLAGGADAAFMIGGRLDIGITTGDAGTTQFNIEVPARVQWYVNDLLALHAEVGMLIQMVGEDGPVFGGTPDSTTISIGSGSVFGGAGFTLYWP